MAERLFYVGSYAKTDGIYICSFDESSGAVVVVERVQAENPSYLVLSEDKRFLYAAIENETTNGNYGGAVAAYKVTEQRRLKFLNQKLTHGKHPCHVSIGDQGRVLFSANYTEGTVCIDSIDKEGIGERLQTIVHDGYSKNTARQEKAHAHFVKEIEGLGLCVCDLGMDKVMVYESKDGYRSYKLKMKLDPVGGSGPRHFVFNEEQKIFYVLNELICDVDLYWVKAKETVLNPNQSVITTDAWERGIETTGAAIHFSRNKRFVLVSNRGVDTITVFRINQDGTLAKIGETEAGGKTPRDFQFDESGDYLFCANQDSNLITVFAFDQENGTLKKLDSELHVEKPVCIVC